MASSKEITQLNQINKGLIATDKNINAVSTSYLALVKNIETGNQIINNNTVSFNNLKKAQKETKESAEKLDKLDKQLQATKTRLIELDDKRQQQLLQNRAEIQKQTKSIKDLNRAKIAEKGSTEQLSAVNVILEKRLRAVNQTTDKGKRSADLLRSAIDKNNKKIKEQSSALGAQRINIGNYGSALDGLSPRLSAATNGIKRMGAAFKLLLANPVVLVISLIVAAFAGLVAIFKSTDEGGTKLAGVFTGIKNVLGVLKTALVQVLKSFDEIKKGNFRAAFREIGDAFKFVADNTKDAFNAGVEYENQLDALNDRIIANISSQEETLRQFREYINLSKDQTKTDQERLNALNEASTAAERYFGQIAKDEKERFDLDVKNTAARIKLTADELAEFIKLDGERARELVTNNKKYAAAWNTLGDDVIKGLEDQYSKAIQADTMFFKRTNEITSLRTGIIKKQQTEQTNAILDAKNTQLEIERAANEDSEELNTEFIDAELESIIEGEEAKLEAEIEGRTKREAEAKEAAERQLAFEQEKANEIVSISTRMGDALGALASGQIKNFKEFSKEILFIALNALEKQILITQTAILAKDISTKGFLGIATAAVKIGLIKAAFSGVKGAIAAFNMGTDNAPSEFIAGDKKGGGSARELMFLRDGTTMLVNEPTYFKGDKFKGATIKSNIETERILAQSQSQNIINLNTDELKRENKKGFKRLERAIMIDKRNQNRAISKAYMDQYL
jgi:hypothetical protein